MTHHLHRVLALCAALILLGGACASEPTAEERAAAREALLESTDGIDPETGERVTPSTSTVTPGASSSTDPAGSAPGETQPAASSTPPNAAPIDTDSLLENAPDDGLRFQLASTLGLAAGAEAACADLPSWTEALDAATSATRTAAATVTASGGAWVDSTNAQAIAATFRDRLIMQSGCEAGAVGGSDADLTAALAAAGRASAANDEMRVALTAGNVKTGSEFWYHADQIGHVIEMDRLAREAGGVDLLILGPSTGKRGFDPIRMTAELGQSTMNASVAGMVPSVLPQWLLQSTLLGGAPSTVVIAVTPWQDLVASGLPPCDDATVARIDEALERSARSFSTIPVFRAQPGTIRMTGGALATYDGPALDASQTYQPGQRGWAETRDVVNGPDEGQVRLYESQLNGSSGCPRYLTAVSKLVTDLSAKDVDVLLVSMPIHPDMSALLERGAAAHEDVAAGYAEMAEATGAGWLDLTDLLDESEFLDLTHANGPGQVKVTTATIEALS